MSPYCFTGCSAHFSSRTQTFGLLILMLLFLSNVSFAKSKPLKSKVKPEEITTLQLFEPLSFVEFIETGNEGFRSDSLSEIRHHFVLKLLKEYRSQLHITGDISLADTSVKGKVWRELASNMHYITRYGNLYFLKPTPVIDSILTSRGQRFGLLIFSYGFIRQEGNYGKEYAKYKAKDFLSLGWDSEKPIPLNSALYAVIFDAKEHDVAFFGESDRPEQPMKEELLKKRFLEIFQGYFFK